MFFVVFVFQKSYTGNIPGIGRNKSRSSYFSRSVMESKAETEGSQEVATPPHGVGHPQATPGPSVGPSPPPNAALCHDPDFFKDLKFHHAFMAYCISNFFSKVLNLILQRILSNALFPSFRCKSFQKESVL
jgi:hypothetical protein